MEPQTIHTTASILRTTLTTIAASKKIFLRPHHDDDVDVRIPHFAAAVAVAAVVVHSKVLIFRRLQKRRERKITYSSVSNRGLYLINVF